MLAAARELLERCGLRRRRRRDGHPQAPPALWLAVRAAFAREGKGVELWHLNPTMELPLEGSDGMFLYVTCWHVPTIVGTMGSVQVGCRCRFDYSATHEDHMRHWPFPLDWELIYEEGEMPGKYVRTVEDIARARVDVERLMRDPTLHNWNERRFRD